MYGDIEGCVALDHLRYFQEAMNASWAKYIAMEPVQDMVNLYGDQRTFLRKMLEAA